MSIQLFIPRFRVDECLIGIRECLEKGWTGLGYKTIEFENAWKTYTGLPNAHFINSNTSGLHLALEVLKRTRKWKDGDEVIGTPLTFVSSNHAVLYANLKPVFADIDSFLCLDPEEVEKRITTKTRAVMFVGMAGNTGKYNDIIELCRSKGLALILDAAHMAGTRVWNEGVSRHVCPEADAVVFSFHSVKNLPTADGGMLCFKNSEHDKMARKLSWLGIDKDTYARTAGAGAYKWMYSVDEVGYKYHGNSIMASIGLVQLKYLDSDNAYRRQLATWYRSNLANASHIGLIPIADKCESATHLFQVRISNRDQAMLALNEHEIYPGVHYRDNTEYPMFAYAKGTCPYAQQVSKELISLPLHLGVTKNEVDVICELIGKYADV